MEEREASTNELVTVTLSGNLDELFCVEYPGDYAVIRINDYIISVHCF